jgi:hypothetical protein
VLVAAVVAAGKPWAEVEACEDSYVEVRCQPLTLLLHVLLRLLLLLLLLQACMAANAKGCSDHAESFCTLVVAKQR